LNVATVATVAPERPVVRLQAARAQKATDLDSAPRTDPGPVAAFVPSRNDGAASPDGVLGLMSGRGLY
jgi:hypothetical protein